MEWHLKQREEDMEDGRRLEHNLQQLVAVGKEGAYALALARTILAEEDEEVEEKEEE